MTRAGARSIFDFRFARCARSYLCLSSTKVIVRGSEKGARRSPRFRARPCARTFGAAAAAALSHSHIHTHTDEVARWEREWERGRRVKLPDEARDRAASSWYIYENCALERVGMFFFSFFRGRTKGEMRVRVKLPWNMGINLRRFAIKVAASKIIAVSRA